MHNPTRDLAESWKVFVTDELQNSPKLTRIQKEAMVRVYLGHICTIWTDFGPKAKNLNGHRSLHSRCDND